MRSFNIYDSFFRSFARSFVVAVASLLVPICVPTTAECILLFSIVHRTPIHPNCKNRICFFFSLLRDRSWNLDSCLRGYSYKIRVPICSLPTVAVPGMRRRQTASSVMMTTTENILFFRQLIYVTFQTKSIRCLRDRASPCACVLLLSSPLSESRVLLFVLSSPPPYHFVLCASSRCSR